MLKKKKKTCYGKKINYSYQKYNDKNLVPISMLINTQNRNLTQI